MYMLAASLLTPCCPPPSVPSSLVTPTFHQIWSLCDPKLTGSIYRPGFFAAMRFIALAQGSSSAPQGLITGGKLGCAPVSPSLSALEATMYAPLPPPLIENFPSKISVNHGRDPPHLVPGVGVCDGGSGCGNVSVSSSLFSVSSSPTSFAHAPATTASAIEGGVMPPPPQAITGKISTGIHGVVSGVGGSFGGVSVIKTISSSPRWSTEGAQPPSRDGGVPAAGISLVGVVPAAGRVMDGIFGGGEGSNKTVWGANDGVGESGDGDDDEDFGSFAGAEGPSQMAQHLESSPAQQDDDDFGDFSGAPTIGESISALTQVAMTPTSAVYPAGEKSPVSEKAPYSAAAIFAGVSGLRVVVESGGGGGDQGTSDAWMMGTDNGVEAANAGIAGKVEGGLDDLIKRSLRAATSGRVQEHLADMVRGWLGADLYLCNRFHEQELRMILFRCFAMYWYACF